MSGLGYVFVSREPKAKLLSLLSQPAFKLALAGADTHMIFQNPDDQRIFIQRRLIDREKTTVIRGSGIDEKIFSPRPETPREDL